MASINNQVINIAIENIEANPYQPRKTFSQQSLEELSQSITSYGILQPISVRKISDNHYELIAGERRLRASQLANRKNIPAIVMDLDDKDSALLAVLENLQREDLNFIEEAQGYYNLIEDHSFTQKQLAEKLGKSQSTIANKLRVLRLPKPIKAQLIENSLTERHARALLKLSDQELQMMVIEKIIENELTVKKTENLINVIMQNIDKENAEKHKNKQNVKNSINFKIYLNTLKNAYTAIKDSGVEAVYKEKDMGEFVEVTVKIPKS